MVAILDPPGKSKWPNRFVSVKFMPSIVVQILVACY